MNNENFNKGSYLALGSFDGLHIGHLTLVHKIVKLARENKGKSILYTFENHPRTLIKGIEKPKLILNNKNKRDNALQLGVDEVYFEKFTEEYMKLTPEGFVEYLCNKFNVKGIVVGFNFKFGYKNLGNVNVLKSLSKKYNYELIVMEPCEYKSEVVSSTRIRSSIDAGNVEDVSVMLNRPYSLEGKVIHGKQLGRTIGFPTANMEINNEVLIPKKGVYYTNVLIKDKIFKGITSIGHNPTVNGKKLSIETYILDFNLDIYGNNIKVYFINRIRDEIKFPSLESLVNQLKIDENFAKKSKNIYNSNGFCYNSH